MKTNGLMCCHVVCHYISLSQGTLWWHKWVILKFSVWKRTLKLCFSTGDIKKMIKFGNVCNWTLTNYIMAMTDPFRSLLNYRHYLLQHYLCSDGKFWSMEKLPFSLKLKYAGLLLELEYYKKSFFFSFSILHLIWDSIS